MGDSRVEERDLGHPDALGRKCGPLYSVVSRGIPLQEVIIPFLRKDMNTKMLECYRKKYSCRGGCHA